MKAIYLLRRASLPDRTLGKLLVFDGISLQAHFSTLEPPWKNNRPKESCIPIGEYLVKPRTSPKFGDHLIVEDVPNRSFILVHRGNFRDSTEGCILIGMNHQDIDNDGTLDVSSSRAAMALLLQFVREEGKLIVI